MKKLRVFKIKYLSPTDTKGSKIKIFDETYQKSKIINYNYNYNVLENVKKYLEKNNINILYQWEGKDTIYLMSDDFNNNLI